MTPSELQLLLASGSQRKKPRHREAEIQEACVTWFKYAHPDCIIFAVPNGGSRDVKEAKNMKREGILAGVADLIIVAKNRVLFVEMKTRKGRQQQSQKDFQEKVEKLGHKYVICRSTDEFRIVVNAWLGETPRSVRKISKKQDNGET